MTLTTSIDLNAIAWAQEIRRYPTINVEGLYLRVTCQVRRSSPLSLNDGRNISGLEIDLSIFPGESSAKYGGLSEKAIGGLWSVHDDNFFIHGSLYLKASDYQAVWNKSVMVITQTVESFLEYLLSNMITVSIFGEIILFQLKMHLFLSNVK